MSSSYPGALDGFTTATTNASSQQNVHPALHNDANDAINKIEAMLGVNPQGAYATLVLRLAAMSGGRVTSTTGTANVTIAATAEATPTTIISLASATYSGNTVRLEFFAPGFAINPASAGHQAVLDLWDDGLSTVTGVIASVTNANTGYAIGGPIYCTYEFTPTAGTHAYSIRGWKSASGDVATVYAGVGGSGTFLPMKLITTYI